MNSINNKHIKTYLVVGATLASLGALKGVCTGLYRTNQRDINDGGPTIRTTDGLLSTVGSTGIILSATTLLGTFEGVMVGLLWPLNLPWGLWQYTKNFYNKNQLVDSDDDDEIVQDIPAPSPAPADGSEMMFIPTEIIQQCTNEEECCHSE